MSNAEHAALLERMEKAFLAKEQYRTDRIELAYRNFLSLMVFENKDEDPSYQTILFSLAECLGKAAYDAEADLRSHVSTMRLKDYRD